jgi:hypothetical protein
MGMISLMTVPPMESSDITMTNRYINFVDERGKEIGVPKSLFGIGELGTFPFHWLQSE